MTSAMQRLAAAIHGEPTDRIPVFCNLIDQGARELGMTLKAYYSKGEHVAEGQLRMLEKYGHDNVWGLFYVGREAELLGCQEIIFAENGPPNVQDLAIRSHADIAALRVPADIGTHPLFEEEMKCMSILKSAVGGKHPICAYISSSMTLPAMLMGMEKWMELLFLGPAPVRDELLHKCHAFFIKELRAYRQAGADVLVYSNPFGSTDTVPMKFFMEFSLPWIEKDIAAVGTQGIVYYCGMSRLNRVLDIVLEKTGIGVCYLSPLDDIAQGKAIVGRRALTGGVINDIKLIDWTPAEVRQEVKRILAAGMPGGRFFFGTGVMPLDIPEENIRAMLEAAFEYGACESEDAHGR
jgi:uroporphyrinogen-III decarboxylase